MKKTILTIATALVMTLTSFANSTITPLNVKDAKSVLLTYLEATSVGNTDFNNFIFTNGFSYKNTANGDKYGKRDYLAFLKENQGLSYNCEKQSEIISQNSKTTVAKTTLKFQDFTRVDEITLKHSKKGWKISKVVTSYL